MEKLSDQLAVHRSKIVLMYRPVNATNQRISTHSNNFLPLTVRQKMNLFSSVGYTHDEALLPFTTSAYPEA